MNEDGSMARVPELLKFCKEHDLRILSIARLIENDQITSEMYNERLNDGYKTNTKL